MTSGVPPRPQDERDLWWRMLRATVGVVFDAAFRLRCFGLEDIPRAGGALITYNHVSVLDPIPVALGADRRGRAVRFLGVADVFDRPVVGWGLRRLRQVPLHRGEGDREALGSAVAALREGWLVGMAPEGTVGDGPALLPGHNGAARISLRAGVPIVPVGVWGTQRRWGKQGPRARRPFRPVVALAFGSPFAVEGEPDSREDVLAVTERIMERLARQVDLARSRS
jgi:1-acyl-sn-glycerol-3-phosphate acyltransferase